MSDYLTNLVSRSTDRGQRITPRLPSLFESALGETTAPFSETWAEQESADYPTFDDNRLDSNNRSRLQASGRATEFAERRAIALPVSEIDNGTDPGNLNIVSPIKSSQQEIAEQELRVFSMELSQDQDATEERQSLAKGPTNSQTGQGTEIRTRAIPEVRLQRKSIPRPTTSSRQSLDHDLQSPATAIVGATEDRPKDITSMSVGRRPRATGDASPARERELRSSLPLEQLLDQGPTNGSSKANGIFPRESREPVVNVTIGRIEVRATSASGSEKRVRQSGSPVMPLDEYLRLQRRGGGK